MKIQSEIIERLCKIQLKLLINVVFLYLSSYRAVQVREVGIYQANIYKWIEKHLLVSLQVTNPVRQGLATHRK